MPGITKVGRICLIVHVLLLVSLQLSKKTRDVDVSINEKLAKHETVGMR